MTMPVPVVLVGQDAGDPSRTPAVPVPLTAGGTGSLTAQGALNNLAGAQTAGYCLLSDGTNVYLQPPLGKTVKVAPAPSGGTSLVSNDQAAVQATVDAVWHAGGGIAFMQPGVHYIPQLTLRNGVILWGSGEAEIFADAQTGLTNGTIIRAPLGSTSHMVIPDPVPSYIASPGLFNLTLDGNCGTAWLTSYSYTATNASPCVFTAAGSSYTNGQQVTLNGGTAPAGFSGATVYFVVSASGASFSLAATSGGTAITSTSTGNGQVAVAPNQAPGAFDGIHFGTKVQKARIQNVTVINVPGDGINLSSGQSYAGSSFLGLQVLNPYGNGVNFVTGSSDTSFTSVIVNSPGQNCFIVGGTMGIFVGCKSNLAGQLGGGAGTQDGWHITSSGSSLSGCVSENDCGPVGGPYTGNGVYVSGNRNKVDVTASAAGNALLYLDGCIYNDIRLTVNSQSNHVQPSYIYQVNGSGTKNNRVWIKGQNPGTTPGTAYANLTSSGSETFNDFLCENEAQTSRQTVAFASAITPDPYLGGHISVGTLTGAITVNNPANGHAGSRMTLKLIQNGTGGWAVAWGGAYVLLTTLPAVPSSTVVITFAFDGTNWNEIACDIGGVPPAGKAYKQLSASASPSATLGTNGSPVTLSPDTGYPGLLLTGTWMTTSGVSSETITGAVTVTFDDTTTASFNLSTSSSNTTNASANQVGTGTKDGHYVTGISAVIQSTKNSSTATATFTAGGLSVA